MSPSHLTGQEPHHDGSPLYVSTASPDIDDRVVLRMRVPESFDPIARVFLRSTPDNEQRFTVASVGCVSSGWRWWECEVEIQSFELGYRFLLCLADGRQLWLNQAGLHHLEPRDSEDFRLISHPAPPEWALSTVIYQIFPDRFARSSDANLRSIPEWAIPADWKDEVISEGPETSRQLYGGDLRGIQDHLSHFDRLGVTMLYLTPIFPARSNHRYDAETFTLVDPVLGGNAALIELVQAAHHNGLKVIGDLTTNHSGDSHEWFHAALNTPDAAESDFYYWLDPMNKTYVSWYGVPSLPKFDWNSRELRHRFIEGEGSVAARWLTPPYNLDGWRVDVANMTGRYLTDDLNAEVRGALRRTMIDVNPDTLLIGESTNDATRDLQGDGWHGAMTYAPFTRPLWSWLTDRHDGDWWFGQPPLETPRGSAEDFYRAHRPFVDGIPWRVRLGNLNALDTHDTPRFVTNAAEGTLAIAVGLSMTMPGIPMVFAGDEFALTGRNGEHSRSPMRWDRIDEFDDTIELYASLIRLRTGHRALSEGGMRWLHVSGDALAFVRETASESVLVVASSADYEIAIPVGSVMRPEAFSAKALWGTASLVTTTTAFTVAGKGASFTAWSLPGVQLEPLSAVELDAPGSARSPDEAMSIAT